MNQYRLLIIGLVCFAMLAFLHSIELVAGQANVLRVSQTNEAHLANDLANEANGSTLIRITPTDQVVQVGKAFTVAINVTDVPSNVNGISAYLDFDSQILNQLQIIPSFDNTMINTNTNGQIDIVSTDFEPVSGTFNVAQIQFKAITEMNETTIALNNLERRQTILTTTAGIALSPQLLSTSTQVVPHDLYLPLIHKEPTATPTPTPTATATATAKPTCRTVEAEPNNTFGNADTNAETHLPFCNTGVSGTHQSDSEREDIFRITITGSSLNVTLTNIPGGTDYDLFVYNSKRERIAVSEQTGTPTESINLSGRSPGNYYLRVYRFSGTSDQEYILRWTEE